MSLSAITSDFCASAFSAMYDSVRWSAAVILTCGCEHVFPTRTQCSECKQGHEHRSVRLKVILQLWHAVQGSAGVTDPAAIDKLCAEGRDAAKFLTQYVVQAELNERGNYGRHTALLEYMLLPLGVKLRRHALPDLQMTDVPGKGLCSLHAGR